MNFGLRNFIFYHNHSEIFSLIFNITSISPSPRYGTINTQKAIARYFRHSLPVMLPINRLMIDTVNIIVATRLKIQEDILTRNMPIHCNTNSATMTGIDMIRNGNKATNFNTLRIKISSISLVVLLKEQRKFLGRNELSFLKLLQLIRCKMARCHNKKCSKAL